MDAKKLPTLCPSCENPLLVQRLECEKCHTSVGGAFGLPVLARLSPEDQAFVISVIMASGSLKEIASQYGLSYPTIRNRLDELIERIKTMENAKPKRGLN
jgi:hypothetical protein